MGGLPDYFDKRAGAVEKLSPSSTQTSSSSTSASKGGKDGEEKKESTSSSSEQKTSLAESADRANHVVAIDVSFYFQLQQALQVRRGEFRASEQRVSEKSARERAYTRCFESATSETNGSVLKTVLKRDTRANRRWRRDMRAAAKGGWRLRWARGGGCSHICVARVRVCGSNSRFAWPAEPHRQLRCGD